MKKKKPLPLDSKIAVFLAKPATDQMKYTVNAWEIRDILGIPDTEPVDFDSREVLDLVSDWIAQDLAEYFSLEITRVE